MRRRKATRGCRQASKLPSRCVSHSRTQSPCFFTRLAHSRLFPHHPSRLTIHAAHKWCREQSWSAASCAKDNYNADARDMELLALRRAGFHGTHPNIANLIQIVTGPSATHAVLEYCGGGSLQRHLMKLQTAKGAAATRHAGARSASQGAMPEAEACSVVAQVAAGLAHLHSLDIAHRDIKPANVSSVSRKERAEETLTQTRPASMRVRLTMVSVHHFHATHACSCLSSL